MILALDGTAIVVSIISSTAPVLVAIVGGWFAYKGIKTQVESTTTDLKSTVMDHADQAADKVSAHLDNGLHTTLMRLDSKLTENGVMVDAIVKTQDRPIFKTEPSGALIYANPAAVKMLGMTVAELTGDGWVRAVHPEDRDRVFKEWRESIRTKREFGPVIYRYIHPTTREETLVEAVATPWMDLDGDILSWVATVVPLTDF